MTNEELLVAMSNMMDQRLDEKLEPLKKDMSEVKDRVTNIELNIENDIRPGIITLCDAYGTQFDRYSISIERKNEDRYRSVEVNCVTTF